MCGAALNQDIEKANHFHECNSDASVFRTHSFNDAATCLYSHIINKIVDRSKELWSNEEISIPRSEDPQTRRMDAQKMTVQN
jgi:hypothetical protein